MEDDDDSFPDHKLCGFLLAVLTIRPTRAAADLRKALSFNTRLRVSGDGAHVGFTSESDVVLVPITHDSVVGDSAGGSAKGKDLESEIGAERGSGSGNAWARKWRRIGLVNGSVSVVHQINALVNHKCLNVSARVVRVSSGGDHREVRVVVLVDVYLPIALWSGWQFPRSKSTVVALFRHLRYFDFGLSV